MAVQSVEVRSTTVRFCPALPIGAVVYWRIPAFTGDVGLNPTRATNSGVSNVGGDPSQVSKNLHGPRTGA